MKTIPLKKIGNFDYKLILLEMLRNAPTRGYTINEVRLAVKAIKVLEVAEQKVDFEDEIYEFVKKVINEGKYIRATSEMVQLFDDIENAK